MSIRIDSDIEWEIDLSIIGPNSRSVFANRDVFKLTWYTGVPRYMKGSSAIADIIMVITNSKTNVTMLIFSL